MQEGLSAGEILLILLLLLLLAAGVFLLLSTGEPMEAQPMEIPGPSHHQW